MPESKARWNRGSLILGALLIVLLCVLSFLVGMIVRGRQEIPIGPGPEAGSEESWPDADPGETNEAQAGRIRVRVLTCGGTDQELSHAMEVMEFLRARDYPDVEWAKSGGNEVAVFVGDFEDRSEAERLLARVKMIRYAGSDAFREAVLAEIR